MLSYLFCYKGPILLSQKINMRRFMSKVPREEPEHPYEETEAKMFFRWLQMQNLDLVSHIPNETRTPYKGVKRKNRAMGVTKGVPDYIICIPAERAKSGTTELLFVELKRVRAANPYATKIQKQWIAALDSVEGVHAIVAYGAQEASAFVGQFLARVEPTE